MQADTGKGVNLRSIAMPAQHGVWGFWLEPSLAALIAAPSWAGACLSIAGLCALLIHHPLTIWLKDRRRGKTYARTVWAGRFTALFGGAALLFLMLALAFGKRDFMIALMLAVPFALLQLGFEVRNQGRHIVAEIGGALAFAALAPAIVLAAGGTVSTALGIWAVMIIRICVSIPYIRARLRLEKDKPTDRRAVLVLHGIGVALLIALALWAGVPWLALIGGAVLLLRAVGGMTALRTPAPAKIIGFREVAYGLVVALTTGLGYVQ